MLDDKNKENKSRKKLTANFVLCRKINKINEKGIWRSRGLNPRLANYESGALDHSATD